MRYRVQVTLETNSYEHAMDFHRLMGTAPIRPDTSLIFEEGVLVDQWNSRELGPRMYRESPVGGVTSPYPTTRDSAAIAGLSLEEYRKRFMPSAAKMSWRLIESFYFGELPSPVKSEKLSSEAFLKGEHVSPLEIKVYKSGSARKPRRRSQT